MSTHLSNNQDEAVSVEKSYKNILNEIVDAESNAILVECYLVL